MSNTIQQFIKSLKNKPSSDHVFNPWYDCDPDNDENTEAPNIRKAHLQYYLEQRKDSARYLLIAEAIGYQGGHFSGIAMTSERILLGHQHLKGIHPHHVFQHHTPKRTSHPDKRPKGFSEPTATIVWGSLLQMQLNPYEFVLWNAVPWHPYQPSHPNGMLSNRTPTSYELEYSWPFLLSFLKLFPSSRVIAIGQKCAATLQSLRLDCPVVRHPANGGATQFREQIYAFLSKDNAS
ncbi:MAG: uracil-DNA glycosylase [SAR324 cluster bacterium]|nr:uracil-DNA glycosylase [SAR324 cluster bacterium]